MRISKAAILGLLELADRIQDRISSLEATIPNYQSTWNISIAARSTLKPEAAIYTPRPVGEKRLESTLSTTKTPVMLEAAGNKVIETLLESRKREIEEEVVKMMKISYARRYLQVRAASTGRPTNVADKTQTMPGA